MGRARKGSAAVSKVYRAMMRAEDFATVLNGSLDGWNRAMKLRCVSATQDEVVAELDLGPEHRQPYGIVHGGVHAGIVEAGLGRRCAPRSMSETSHYLRAGLAARVWRSAPSGFPTASASSRSCPKYATARGSGGIRTTPTRTLGPPFAPGSRSTRRAHLCVLRRTSTTRRWHRTQERRWRTTCGCSPRGVSSRTTGRSSRPVMETSCLVIRDGFRSQPGSPRIVASARSQRAFCRVCREQTGRSSSRECPPPLPRRSLPRKSLLRRNLLPNPLRSDPLRREPARRRSDEHSGECAVPARLGGQRLALSFRTPIEVGGSSSRYPLSAPWPTCSGRGR